MISWTCSCAHARCCETTPRSGGRSANALSHLFVDEFQDTDPLQAEIVVLLAGAPEADRVSPVDWRDVRPRPGSLFIVGDPKQSIYRFRRADIGTYRVVCDWLEERRAKHATLTTSFRATPAIQRLVNAAFAPLMTDDALTQQPPYVPLTPSRDDHASQPAVVALPVPRPYGTRNVTKGAIDKSLPDAVGAFLKWLFDESRWKVTERSPTTGRRASWCRSGLGTCVCCSGASPASTRTSPGRTSRRWKRATSRTCSSAASRFTTAKRSRRFARR